MRPSAAAGASKALRASAGGARGTRGVLNQASVAAWLAAHALAEQPAPWIPGNALLVAVGGETGLEVDDVGAITDHGGVLVVQAKGALQLRNDTGGAFGQAVEQVVSQFLSGLPSDGHGNPRSIDATRDVLVIAGDGRSSRSVHALATVTMRLRTLPEEVPLYSTSTSAEQRKALGTLLKHVRAAWHAAAGADPSDGEIRGLLRVLVVDVLDLADDGAHRATAVAHLRSVLLDPARDTAAWVALGDLGARLAADRAWYRRADIAAWLDAAGVPAGPAGRHAADLETLRRLTNAARAGLAAHTTLPTGLGPIHCDRSAVEDLAAVDGSFVIIGEPGCGKSGVISELTARLAPCEDMVVLTVDTLPRSSNTVSTELGLGADLLETLQAWSGSGRATLILDGLDAARGEGTTWLSRLCESLAGSRWRVVSSMRRFDLEHSAEWQKIFAGVPLRPGSEFEASDLPNVRHYLLGDFTDQDLAYIASASPTVAGVLSGAAPQLLKLVRNPFNLRLATELVNAGTTVVSLANTRDQLHLLQRYWRLRVVDAVYGLSRVRVLAAVAREMLRTRRLRADTAVVPDNLLEALEELLREGVLREAPAGLLADASSLVVYSHHILFDFAVAATVLTAGGESRLAAALLDDPNLELVARPSLDLHLADLWHAQADHRAFAAVIRDLAIADHPVAGLAAARVALENVRVPSDLGWACAMFSHDLAAATTITASICGAMEAIDPRPPSEVAAAITALAGLASAATDALEFLFDQATGQTILRLLLQLDAMDALTPTAHAATIRARAAARLMDASLVAPTDRGWLAMRAARLLPAAVTVDPELAATIQRSLATGATAETEVLRQYVEAIEVLAACNPDLATEVLTTVFTRSDDSDEMTYISRGVLNLTSTRKQDYNHVRWLVGEKFASFLKLAGLHRGITVMAAVLRSGHEVDTDGDPIEAYGGSGRLWHAAKNLRYSDGHGASLQIVDSFLATLRESHADATEAKQALKAMVEQIAHPVFWRKLLDVAEALPAWRLPTVHALSSGALLKNGETRAAAGRLMQSLSSTLTAQDHATLIERPIRRAADLYNNDLAEWRERTVDQLLGCLDPNMVVDVELRLRLQSLLDRGGPPTIPPARSVEPFWEPIGLPDALGPENHPEFTDAATAAIAELRSALDRAQQLPSQERVAILGPAFHTAVAEAGSLDAPSVQEQIARAAELLSTAAEVTPGMTLGGLIMDIILVAERDL